MALLQKGQGFSASIFTSLTLWVVASVLKRRGGELKIVERHLLDSSASRPSHRVAASSYFGEFSAAQSESIDVLDVGGDDDIVIQLVPGDTITSAAEADEKWLAKNVRIANGKTVVTVGGKERTLARTDLSELIKKLPKP